MSLLNLRILLNRVFQVCLAMGSGVVLTACFSSNRLEPPEKSQMAVWSPDGAYIAYVCYKDGPIFQDPVEVYFDTDAAEICIMDADGSNKRRLTHNQVFDWYPIWSPDGKSIAFVSFDGLYVIDMKRGETRQLFEDRLGIMLNPEWSPDGLRVVFSTCRPGDESGSDIFIVDGMGNEIIKLDNPTNATLGRPRWSLDGHLLAYGSTLNPKCSTLSKWMEGTSSLMIVDISTHTAPIEVADGIRDLNQLIWSDPAHLIYSSRPGYGAFNLFTVDLRSGEQTLLKADGFPFALSRDGAWLAYIAPEPDSGLYIEDLLRGTSRRVVEIHDNVYEMEWSPDGRQLLIDRNEEVPGRRNSYTDSIWVVERETGSAKRLTPLLSDEPAQ